MRIGIVAYDGFDELDALGPYEVLRTAAREGAPAAVSLVSDVPAAHVTGSHGLTVAPQASLDDGAFDLVVVPGGGWNDRAAAGAYAEARRGALPSRLRALHLAGAAVASVCTGAMLLAAAGLVRGRRCTTHRLALDDLRAEGAELVEARVVDDGELLSCGGVTAGIDLALWIVEREWGKGLADGIADEMEHQRRGPIWTRQQALVR